MEYSSAHAQAYYKALHEVLKMKAVPLHNSMVEELRDLLARGGRLFCIGVGGGAANAAHAACDFRKLCGIEAYAPSDNIAEITARTNDEGWSTVFEEWLCGSCLRKEDALFVFSVGGGTPEVSSCIYRAVALARRCGARVLGVVGSASGATALHGDAVVVTEASGLRMTPVTEAAQLAVLHALVSDPRLQINKTKW